MANNPSKTTTQPEKALEKDKQNKIPFVITEAYKTIRIHLISELNKINGKVVAITSPNASEGKSTTAVNIAITLSQLNKKVILIDADSRLSTIHKKLKITNDIGCLDVISKTTELGSAIKKYNSNLDILTSGTTHNNPSELYSTPEFNELLDSLKKDYDYVVIDTPPVNLVSDTFVIAQKCDGILFIVRSAVTTYQDFAQALNSAKQLNINVLGTVINGVDSLNGKKYRYKKYYKYGYNYYRN